MSWQGYVDNLMGTKHMTACGIFGLDGSTWASSAQFPVSFIDLFIFLKERKKRQKEYMPIGL